MKIQHRCKMDKVAATVEPLNNDFVFGPWTIKTVKGTIMKSSDCERYRCSYNFVPLSIIFDFPAGSH